MKKIQRNQKENEMRELMEFFEKNIAKVDPKLIPEEKKVKEQKKNLKDFSNIKIS